MSKPYIPLLLGTGREGRYSEHAAKYLFEKLRGYPLKADFIDIRDVAAPFTIASWTKSNATKTWQKIATKAEGFIFVFPEYNHGYPGEMKMLLDQALDHYAQKPVLLAGVSAGRFGGARGVENLLPVLRELRLIPLQDTLYFPNIKDLAGRPFNEWDTLYQERIDKAVHHLLFYTEKLAGLRKKREQAS